MDVWTTVVLILLTWIFYKPGCMVTGSGLGCVIKLVNSRIDMFVWVVWFDIFI